MNNYMNFNRELDYTEYMVNKGDTLYKIAKNYNTSVEELMIMNNLSTTQIFPNQILLVPNNNGYNSYNKYNNDTIRDLLNRYNVSLCDLSDNDSFYNLKLMPNQELKMNTPMYYIVDNDDRVEDILYRSNITKERLLQLNSDNWFKPGNKIIVG